VEKRPLNGCSSSSSSSYHGIITPTGLVGVGGVGDGADTLHDGRDPRAIGVLDHRRVVRVVDGDHVVVTSTHHLHTHTHTHTQRLTALCAGLHRSAGTARQNQSGFK